MISSSLIRLENSLIPVNHQRSKTLLSHTKRQTKVLKTSPDIKQTVQQS